MSLLTQNDPNASEIDYWNGPGGRNWVHRQTSHTRSWRRSCGPRWSVPRCARASMSSILAAVPGRAPSSLRSAWDLPGTC